MKTAACTNAPTSKASSAKKGVLVLAALLLLPAFISPWAHILERQGAGMPLFNLAQIFLWALFIPVCLHFFRTRVPARRHMLFYGIAIGSGHLWWMLLAPLVGPALTAEPELAALAIRHYQLMLNILRALLAVGIAMLVYLLATRSSWCTDSFSAGGLFSGGTDTPPSKAHTVTYPHFPWQFLLPLAVLFFMNGLAGNLFIARLNVHSQYPGLMHLVMALWFIFLGLLLHNGKLHLKFVLYAASFTFVCVPVFFGVQPNSVLYELLHILFSMAHQTLLFSGTLITFAYAPYSPRPLTTTCAVWLVSSIFVPGGLCAKFVLPHLPFSRFAVLCACAVLALALFPLLRKAFPLPETPEEALEEPLEEPHTVGAEKGLSIQEATAASLAVFAAHYTLTERESQIVALLAQGASSEEMTQTLGIKDSTLRPYISRLLKKTETDNRLHLARLASSFQTKGGTPHGTTVGASSDGTPSES